MRLLALALPLAVSGTHIWVAAGPDPSASLKSAVDECYPTSGPISGPPDATGPCATPIGQWDVSAVTDMNGLFYNISYFNEDISDWDTGAVTDMESMFYDAKSFNQPLP